LRIPSRGRLEELRRLFAADQQVSAGAQQRYRKLGAADSEPADSEFGTMLTFRKTAGPGLPIEAALTLTEAVRAALMSNAGNSGPIADVIHGHNGGTHCAIAALPFVGRTHADGHLLGFAVILPRTVAITDRRAVLAASDELVDGGLHIPDVGNWALEASDQTAIQQTLRPATWIRASKIWQTVTPTLLDRFPKKNGPGVEAILTQSCQHIRLPEPVRVEHGPYSKLQGVPPVPAFRLRRAKDSQPRWGVHATIEFPRPVRGPVLLGAGRYFGLGLMRPQQEDNREPA
jgi:CRISPR-associated protein Csb2